MREPRRALNWTETSNGFVATIPGMVNVEISAFDINLYDVIINGVDTVVEGGPEIAKAWAEGFIAGRFREIKVEVNLKK